MFLYLITNVVTGKEYVGVTVKTVKARFREHRLSATRKSRRTPLYSSMRKYGTDAFVIETLASFSSFEDLLRAEVDTIAARGTLVPNGYNVVEGGKGTRGQKVSEETRRLMSAKRMGVSPWNKGVPISQETRDKLTGLRHSPETKKRMAAYRRGWWKDKRAAIGKNAASYFIGSQSTREKIAALKRAWWAGRKAEMGDEAGKFLKGPRPSAPYVGLRKSEASKKKSAVTRRDWWAGLTPEARQAMGDKIAAGKRRAQAARTHGDEGASSAPNLNFDAEDQTP